MLASQTAMGLLCALTSIACRVPRDLPPDAPRRIPPIAVAEPTAESSPSQCVRVWPEARLRNYAYDHVVHLQSNCHRTASCEVSTNVAPKVVVIAVEPGQAIEVVTLRGSENPEFTPFVRCSAGTR
jgi:hypothetical protein